MSEYEHYIGKMIKEEKQNNETLEEQCKRMLNNVELDSFYESYAEMLVDELYRDFYVHNGDLYKIDKRSIDPDHDVFEASKGNDSTIDFEVRYYNGGCGFNEAIEEALENLK